MENQKKLELTLCGIKPYNAKWTDPRGIVRDLTALNLNFAKNPHLHSLDKLKIVFEEMTEEEKSIICNCENLKQETLFQEPFFIIEKLKKYHFNIYDLPTEMYIEKSTTNYKEYNKPSVIEEKFCQCNPNRNLDTSTYLVCKECDKKL